MPGNPRFTVFAIHRPMPNSARQRWFVQEILPHEAVLRGYLGRFLSALSDIEDGLQETYARLLSLSDEERVRIRSPHAFLFTTARNIALDRLRRQRIVSLEAMAELDQLDVMDERPGADDELNARQELGLLTRAIASLPERCRQVLTLRKVYGLSQKDIAAKLNISENTVESQIANGMRLCAARLFALSQGDAGAAAARPTKKRNTDAET